MNIIDVHAHYYDEGYIDDLENLISYMQDNGVRYIINASASVEESKICIELAKKYNGFFGVVIGIHPENVGELKRVNELEKLYLENKEIILGIGEVGLDYHYTKENKEEQKQLFIEQIKLAEKYNLPLVIHSRDAAEDTLSILKEQDMSIKVMFHCFDLNEQTANYIIQKGYSISLGGNITYKRKETAINVIRNMPLERIMTETDSPYLSPEPNRGERNNSTNIKYVIEKLAEIKNIDKQIIENTTYNNAIDFFNLQI